MNPGSEKQERRSSWNKGLMETLKGVDALVIHMYAGAGSAAADSPARAGDADDTADPARSEQRGGQRQARRKPNNEVRPFATAEVSIALGQPFQRWQAARTDDFKSLPPDIPVWYTEYNLFDRNAPVHGTWMHGLFAATTSLLYLEESRVKLACLHALVGNAVFAAVFSSEKGFRLAGFTSPPDPPPTTPLALTVRIEIN